ncbi:MAG: hypothetical protein JKY60_02790 [Kordiimonadaceae bacterium]|nr:hypothetical protein [Kordiimonadaceae bacterium]
MTREIVEETIAVDYDKLDTRLARLGCNPKTLADQFDTRLPEMRRFLKGTFWDVGFAIFKILLHHFSFSSQKKPPQRGGLRPGDRKAGAIK